ncbi:MAG: hypothetical protein JWS12_880 [Candidatus Saccharibacteria bacterium]|nr:hypothetical protein [Candidatus Saccharibacteria bacterium]
MTDDLLTQPAQRDVIESFAAEIRKSKMEVKGNKQAIPFRPDVLTKKVRQVYLVPTTLLRFRQENGRIASDVESYEKSHEPLDETKKNDQDQLRKFLEDKDPEKTEELVRSLEHDTQQEPAVITADGFLINGNRRKMALEILQERTHDPSQFSHMKVVILPDRDEEGGEPTKVDIELLENAYQFHHEGKSEYYNFDRALSIRRKEQEVGIPLEMQLKQDSKYAKLTDKKFEQEVKKYRDDYLGPLECIDKYLEYIGRPGDYSAISGGKADRMGSWQAFLDYYKSVDRNLREVKTRLKMNVEDYEVSAVEDAAFKILRQRDFGGSSNAFVPNKINDIMRKLPRVLQNAQAKKELLKLKSVPDGEGVDDAEWIEENHKRVSHLVTEAFRQVNNQNEREEPIAKLERALNLLNSEDIDPSGVPISNLPEGLKVINALKDRVEELKDGFWHANKKSNDAMDHLKFRSS